MSSERAMARGAPAGWDPSLSVGNALLDRQHILLFELSRTFTLDSPGWDAGTLRAAFADILDVAHRHCMAEEQLLLGNGFEWLAQHREEHLAGLDRLQAVWAEVACGTVPRERLPIAVHQWLADHLSDMDLPAREWLLPAPGRIGDPDGPDPLEPG